MQQLEEKAAGISKIHTSCVDLGLLVAPAKGFTLKSFRVFGQVSKLLSSAKKPCAIRSSPTIVVSVPFVQVM